MDHFNGVHPYEAKVKFLELCLLAANPQKDFRWKDLLLLGKQAGYAATVSLHTTGKNEKKKLSFYAETLVRAILESGSGCPTITEFGDVLSVNTIVYGKLEIVSYSEWLPMFQVFALRTKR